MKPVSRRELDELLSYPRQYLRGRLPTVHDCPHATNFDPLAPECQTCRESYECRWLYDNDEYSALEAAESERVLAALKAVLDQALVNVAGHKNCACPSCSWLRRATRVMKRAKASGIETADAAPRAE